MCGIAGFFQSAGLPGDAWHDVIERMTATLIHRGPDDCGRHVDAYAALGHRRLSIIDLQAGRQPMANEDGSVHVVFNGEIYNHRDLRQLLESKGHTFRTRSDTEAIMHAYEEWGESCVERLRGMFAFAIWDAKRRRLVLARDRLGKKPLYYAVRDDGTVIFGSELKALAAFPGLRLNIDLEALSDYLSLLYVPRDKSIFREARKLLPGHHLVADAAGVRVQRYWDLSFAQHHGAEGAAERVAELLRDAVAVRLQSDVPLGAFLSGGVDSSAVVGLMAQLSDEPVSTASIGFPAEGFDELAYAREVAALFGTDHREYVVSPRALEILERLVWHYDEPFADSSAVPTYYVSQLARQSVTVALSGDGGDESFAGYRRYWFDVRENKVRALIPAAVRQPLFRLLGTVYPKADYLPQIFRGKAFLSNVARAPWEAYLHSVSGISEDDKERVLQADVRRALAGYRTADVFADLYAAADGPDALTKIQYIDFKTYLPDDILTKVDRASMAHGLEVRCPFLDHALVEYVAGLPSQLKLRGARSKIVLKEAMRGLLPSRILDRPKMGFAMPVGEWLRRPLRDQVAEEVVAAVRTHALFEPATVASWWRQHCSGLRDRSTELWALLVFNRWHRRFAAVSQGTEC
jgi:asparagine synthase (glutamine-hydrolysing)